MYHWIIRLLYLSFYFVQCGTRLFNSHRFKTSIQPSCTWKSMTGIAAVATILLATATSTSRRSLSAHRIILLYHCKARKRGTLSLSSQSIRYGWIFVLLYYYISFRVWLNTHSYNWFWGDKGRDWRYAFWCSPWAPWGAHEDCSENVWLVPRDEARACGRGAEAEGRSAETKHLPPCERYVRGHLLHEKSFPYIISSLIWLDYLLTFLLIN